MRGHRASCRCSWVGASGARGELKRLAAARGGGASGPGTGQRLVPWRARARDPPGARRRRAALPRAVSLVGRSRRRRSIFCPCAPASVEEVPVEDLSPQERGRKDLRLLRHPDAQD